MANKLKIMAVDDEPNVTKLIRRVLMRAGYEVIEVNDPKKIEDYILYTQFSLVISDVMMPGIDGIEVLKKVKEIDPDMPVIMLTGVTSLETAVEATKLGAAEYLTKPLNNESLLKSIKKHVKVDNALPNGVIDFINSKVHGIVTDPNKIVLDDEIISTETIPDGFVEVKFDSIMPGQFLPFAIFVQIFNKKTKRHYLRKICHENTVYTSGLAQILKKRGLSSIYIMEQDYGAYLEYHTAMRSASTLMKKQSRDQKKLVLYGKALEAVSEILDEPIENKNIESALDLVDSFFRTIVDDPVTYQDMFRLFKRDTTIFNHSANVCLLAVSWGVFLGMDPKMVNVLGFGALFHDIGMNRVDRRILDKETPLTRDEWREIQKHPERGLALLKNSKKVPVGALRVILEHHEEEDGSGYPRGIKHGQISNLARICRIVDKFDGMTTEKTYRPAFSAAEALKRIYYEESSPKFQKIIRRFIEFLGGGE